MGWLWSSSGPVGKNVNEEGNLCPSASSPTTKVAPQISSPDHHESAGKDFFHEWLSDATGRSKAEDEMRHINTSMAQSQLNVESAPSSSSSSNPSAKSDRPKQISEQLLPTEMSCREAFDSAIYCNSLGGSFNHLYRYGTARSCHEHWNKFWLCMRIRTYDDESKKNAVQEYYRQVEQVKYGQRGTSSEDIWKSRDHLVERGTAFRGLRGAEEEGEGKEEWVKTDEEWRNAALEMRMRIVQAAENSTK